MNSVANFTPRIIFSDHNMKYFTLYTYNKKVLCTGLAPMMPPSAQPHDGPHDSTTDPEPHSPRTSLTCLHLNLISINYYILWLHTLNVVKAWIWIGKKFTEKFYLSHVMAYETFPYSYTPPHIHLWIFKTLQVIIFWVRVTHKMLNVNWEKIHSIILSVTCHGLRNFPLLIHIPSYPFVNFQNPTSYYFLS